MADQRNDGIAWTGESANPDRVAIRQIDATEDLRQRVLPGSLSVGITRKDGTGGAYVDTVLFFSAPTEPLARLLAILAALIAKE